MNKFKLPFFFIILIGISTVSFATKNELPQDKIEYQSSELKDTKYIQIEFSYSC